MRGFGRRLWAVVIGGAALGLGYASGALESPFAMISAFTVKDRSLPARQPLSMAERTSNRPADIDGESEDEPWVVPGRPGVGPPEPLADCERRLDEAGVVWSAATIPLRRTQDGAVCGAEQVVRYHRGPGGIRWRGKPKVTCPMALAMAQLELIVQQEAQREFGRGVRRIRHMGTYNCRKMATSAGWASEHSYANAIDIKEFELRRGRTIPILGNYRAPAKKTTRPAGRFLRRVARRLYDERVFRVVLTPAYNRAHRNHFHLDRARYWVDGT